jgi:hypothetical protein
MRKVITLCLGLMATVLIGCGPTDSAINASVKQKLAGDDTVKAANIDATTQKKVVTLTGTVNSQETKDRATADARQADGVADVVNQLTVAQSGEGPGGPGGPGYGPGMSNGAPNGSGSGSGGMNNGGGQGSGGVGMNNGGGQGSGGSGMHNGGGMGPGGTGMHHNGGMGTGKMGHNGGQGSGGSTQPPPPKKPQ